MPVSIPREPIIDRNNPIACPICQTLQPNADDAILNATGTMEENYSCDDIECGSTWTVVYRCIQIKDVTDNRTENWEADEMAEIVGQVWSAEPWDVTSETEPEPELEPENWEVEAWEVEKA